MIKWKQCQKKKTKILTSSQNYPWNNLSHLHNTRNMLLSLSKYNVMLSRCKIQCHARNYIKVMKRPSPNPPLIVFRHWILMTFHLKVFSIDPYKTNNFLWMLNKICHSDIHTKNWKQQSYPCIKVACEDKATLAINYFIHIIFHYLTFQIELIFSYVNNSDLFFYNYLKNTQIPQLGHWPTIMVGQVLHWVHYNKIQDTTTLKILTLVFL
jgi:hypothetical protein